MSLTSLILSKNGISDVGANRLLAAMPHNRYRSTLHLAPHALRVYRQLSECQLDGNNITGRIVRLIVSLTRDNAARYAATNRNRDPFTTPSHNSSSSAAVASAAVASASSAPIIPRVSAPALHTSSSSRDQHNPRTNTDDSAVFTPHSSSLASQTPSNSGVFGGSYRLTIPSPPPTGKSEQGTGSVFIGQGSDARGGSAGLFRTVSPFQTSNQMPIGSEQRSSLRREEETKHAGGSGGVRGRQYVVQLSFVTESHMSCRGVFE
jgi:hypothetical protein